MDLVAEIRRFLEKQGIGPCHLLAAVSGGPDSTAMMLALADLRKDGFAVTVAHVNHHLRGEAAQSDEDFVRGLCAAHDLRLEAVDGTLDPEAVRERGVEAAAREVRYRELQKLRDRTGARFIVTAHHQQDQAETVLMCLLTGSSVERLAGIAPMTPQHVIRPLLDVPRSVLGEFLKDRGVTARVDSTNAELRFLRNRIRHELIPLMEQFNPRVTESLTVLAHQVRDRSRAFDTFFKELSHQWMIRTPTATEFPLEAFPADPWLQRAILWREIRRLDPDARDISSRDLVRLAESMPTLKRVSVTRKLELVRHEGSVSLKVHQTPAASPTRTLKPGAEVRLNGSVLRLEKRGAASPPYADPSRSFQLFQLPADAAAESFEVRTRKRGERFQPLGLPHEKKLNEFLIDRKIPRDLRDQIPLLTWNDEIIWISGVEVSEKFKVAEPWRDAYRVSIERDPHS